MALINITNLSRFIGTRCIFSSVSLSVDKKDRIGIVGRNGQGKTTLLRAIAGEIEPDSGSVHVSSSVSLGYLSQGLPDYTTTVFNEAMAGRPEVMEASLKMKDLETKMALGCGDMNSLLEEYSKAQGRFESMGGYDLEHETASVLAGLGLSSSAWHRPAAETSGGQKVRLNLAKLLISRPDILLLDEPTNHLDISGVEWLEAYLSRYFGAILVVSHDRRFLDNLANRIWEIDMGEVLAYKGGFTSYTVQKQDQLRQQQEKYVEQQELIQRTEQFIQKWKANARRTGQAKSREKMLKRLQLVEKPKRHANLRLKLDASTTTGKQVLQLKDFSKSYECRLFSEFDFHVLRGERIALVGPNGCGKTTFLKCLMGIEAHTGFVRWGVGIQKGYYAQDFSFTEPERTVFEEIRSYGVPEREARDVLGRFLFSGDDVKKQICNLSGGEKSRLALVRLVLSDANVLLLDEPTNHLDLPSRGALEEALANYEGTIIFASHDRFLIDSVATKVLYFEDGKIYVFDGTYSDFRLSRNPVQTPENQASKRKPGLNPGSNQKAPLTMPDETEIQARLNLFEEIELVEEEISELEIKERELAAVLADPATYSADVDVPIKQWGMVKSRLDELYGLWERLHTQETY